jgi:hypothetical protein
MKQNELVVEVTIDSVKIAGQEIKRPNRIARSAWVIYWERVASQPMTYFGDRYATH